MLAGIQGPLEQGHAGIGPAPAQGSSLPSGSWADPGPPIRMEENVETGSDWASQACGTFKKRQSPRRWTGVWAPGGTWSHGLQEKPWNTGTVPGPDAQEGSRSQGTTGGAEGSAGRDEGG